jgi:hypothetical protein
LVATRGQLRARRSREAIVDFLFLLLILLWLGLWLRSGYWLWCGLSGRGFSGRCSRRTHAQVEI